MMEEYTSLCSLFEKIRTEQCNIIGVDGTNGTRKTTVAGALAMELDLPLISLDNYLQKNRGGFIEHLQYDELSNEIKEHRTFIVEGVCLLQALEKVDTHPDILLYLKRYHLGLWADERELCVSPEQVEEFLKGEHELAARLSRTTTEEGPCLLDDIVRYHSQYRPEEHAQYFFRWNER